MRRFAGAIIICFTCLVALTGEARAQRGTDWMTDNADAQRSGWVQAGSDRTRRFRRSLYRTRIGSRASNFCGRSSSTTSRGS
jgi:hypothetical protein